MGKTEETVREVPPIEDVKMVGNRPITKRRRTRKKAMTRYPVTLCTHCPKHRMDFRMKKTLIWINTRKNTLERLQAIVMLKRIRQKYIRQK